MYTSISANEEMQDSAVGDCNSATRRDQEHGSGPVRSFVVLVSDSVESKFPCVVRFFSRYGTVITIIIDKFSSIS